MGSYVHSFLGDSCVTGLIAISVQRGYHAVYGVEERAILRNRYTVTLLLAGIQPLRAFEHHSLPCVAALVFQRRELFVLFVA